MTLVASFAFEVNPGSASNTPTVYSTATGLYQSGADQLFTGGEWLGWDLQFTLPSGYRSPSWGLWFNATVTVQPTNEVYQE